MSAFSLVCFLYKTYLSVKPTVILTVRPNPRSLYKDKGNSIYNTLIYAHNKSFFSLVQQNHTIIYKICQ